MIVCFVFFATPILRGYRRDHRFAVIGECWVYLGELLHDEAARSLLPQLLKYLTDGGHFISQLVK